MIRVVHYLNQFFGGIGGEDKADLPLQVRSGPVGPGLALARALAGRGEVAATLIAGDNYASEHQEELLAGVLQQVAELRPDVVVAGPAFNAGRYGTACGAVLAAIQERFGIPGVTGLSTDNPGVELFRQKVYIVPTANSAAGMTQAVGAIARLAVKLAERAEIGPAEVDGYFPRGVRRNIRTGRTNGARAVDMAIARVLGRPFVTELAVPAFAAVAPPPPVADLSQAVVALVTEGGIVPPGNPDRLETWNATRWFRYSVAGKSGLEAGDAEGWHGGYITEWVNADPDRNVPLDAARALERAGVIGKLHDYYITTTGNVANISTMVRIGREIAHYLQEQGVTAAILTAT